MPIKLYKVNPIWYQQSKTLKYDPNLFKITSVQQHNQIIRILINTKAKYLDIEENSWYSVIKGKRSNSIVCFRDTEQNTVCDLGIETPNTPYLSIKITPLKYQYEITLVPDARIDYKDIPYDLYSVKHSLFVDGKNRITKLKS